MKDKALLCSVEIKEKKNWWAILELPTKNLNVYTP